MVTKEQGAISKFYCLFFLVVLLHILFMQTDTAEVHIAKFPRTKLARKNRLPTLMQ